jgi:multidrug efflux pump subunit AcrA (membrane-fusion protein)
MVELPPGKPVTPPGAPVAGKKSALTWLVGGALLLAAVAGVGLGALKLFRGQEKKEPEPEKAEAGTGHGARVTLKAKAIEQAGVKVEKLQKAPFVEVVRVPGRLALDETRLAHMNPVVDGIIQEVSVRLGQEVKAGDVLATLECKDLAEAKLNLVKARLGLQQAEAQQKWSNEVGTNTLSLLQALDRGVSIVEIEKMFRGKNLGDLRQQLVTSYSRRLQAKAQYDAVNQPDVLGAVSQANLIKLRAESEAAEAGFFALCEELKFQSAQQMRVGEQKLREAQTAEALAKTQLLMMGFTRDEVGQMNPIEEGERVSRYPLRSPMAGTIIEQHAVLRERVGLQNQMFQIANLNTLWLKADVPQRDMRVAQGLAGGYVRFSPAEGAGSEQAARVLYTGDVVDPATRTVNLLAEVDNTKRQWKPGMYVEVMLVRAEPGVLQVPLEAVQRQDTQTFVFVRESADTFRRADVKLGRQADGKVEVTQGLGEGQEVVVSGGFILKSELFKEQLAGD